ncbi:class I SAM-dependent methyltransferase [Herbivorax sp. ANBcel31]|nr:class I SAM-dependent methyltransferase [Herbivorax sp. ANBcel31]MDQ2085399.1 class I SAM-dependent methyltransferase [Herbivorax sp. ANBcel31]
MYDVDYKNWADFIENIFKVHKIKPSLMLDLACGTGSFTVEMAKRGYDMIGVDISTDMLNCAKHKSFDFKNILYLNQDMIDFELYGTVDTIICLMDSLNYILYKKDVKKLLKNVYNYLNDGGLFIFDINTPFKFKNILKNNVFYDVSEEITYIWQNYFDSKKNICEFDLTVFMKENNIYKRIDEVHLERCYEINDLKKMISESGLKLLNIYDNLKLRKISSKTQRGFFVCKKEIN